VVDFGPRLDQALLSSWKRATDAVDGIEGKHGLELLVGRMEVWAMMWRSELPETSG
jgi:hypothetical protein